MSNIPGVPEAERVCDNCMRPYCPYARRDTTCPSPEDFRETVDSLRKRAEAIIAELEKEAACHKMDRQRFSLCEKFALDKADECRAQGKHGKILEARIADLKKRVAASDREVEQTLGKALGYAPLYPEASRVDDGQVNVGEHVPTTIAQVAATRIAVLTAERDDLQKIVDAHVTVFDEIGTALGMSHDALPNGHFYAGGVLDEMKRRREVFDKYQGERDEALSRVRGYAQENIDTRYQMRRLIDFIPGRGEEERSARELLKGLLADEMQIVAKNRKDREAVIDEQRGQLAAMREVLELEPAQLERLAELVHKAYLETCAQLGWDVKPANQVPYNELTMDSQELDRASVRIVMRDIRRRALATDAGKPEADVIAAALDDFHPDALADIAYDLDMTTGAEGHEDAILAYLKTLPTAEAVERLQGKEKG